MTKTSKKYDYYVVFRRVFYNQYHRGEDIINLYTFDEAVENQWVDKDGKRIWYWGQNASNEVHPTFVFGFDNLDEAVQFADNLKQREIGIDSTYLQ